MYHSTWKTQKNPILGSPGPYYQSLINSGGCFCDEWRERGFVQRMYLWQFRSIHGYKIKKGPKIGLFWAFFGDLEAFFRVFRGFSGFSGFSAKIVFFVFFTKNQKKSRNSSFFPPKMTNYRVLFSFSNFKKVWKILCHYFQFQFYKNIKLKLIIKHKIYFMF